MTVKLGVGYVGVMTENVYDKPPLSEYKFEGELRRLGVLVTV